MISYSEWRYFGLGKERFDELSYRVSRDNLKVLRTESVVVTACAFVFGAVFTMLPSERIRGIGLLFVAAVSVIVHILAGNLKSEDSVTVTQKTNRLIFWFQALMLGAGIFCGGFLSEYPAAIIMGALIVVPISFDLSPKRNLVVVLAAVIVFDVVSFFCKDLTPWIHDAVNGICATVLGLIMSWRKSKDKWDHEDTLDLIEKKNADLFKDSTTDPLTGLMNRRNAFEELEVMAAEAIIKNKPIVCVIMDVDYFKNYNDTYGHPEGDKLLSALGHMLLNMASVYDVNISRIGGEEFMAFWIPVNASDSAKFANDVLSQVHELDHPEKSAGKHSTISLGIFEAVPGEEDTGNRIYIKADRAVYAAKENGRDRFEYYTPDMGIGDTDGQ